MQTKLILIRHGETAYNARKKYCGHIDARLNAKGEAQALELRGKLAGIPIDVVYASDLRRAVKTARLALGDVRVVRVRQMREMNFGALEGLTYRQALKKYPERYKKWLEDPLKNPALPRAESVPAFQARVVGALKKIVAANHGKTVAVFCHGGPISVFLASILNTEDVWRYLPESAGIRIVEYRGDKPHVKEFNRAKRRRPLWEK
jgi:broad specificity phosphatase PhoE